MLLLLQDEHLEIISLKHLLYSTAQVTASWIERLLSYPLGYPHTLQADGRYSPCLPLTGSLSRLGSIFDSAPTNAPGDIGIRNPIMTHRKNV